MRPSRTSRWPTRTRTSATGRRSARPSGTVASRSRPRRRSARMAAPVAMRAALRPSDGLLSFRVAIIATVVGLLVVTCGFLLGFGIHAAQKSVGTLKNEYLEQVADTTVREVSRLPDTAEQILRVQRFRFETGLYSTSDPVALARALAGALQTDPDIQWVSYSDDATGRFMGGRRLEGSTFILNLSDPQRNGGVPWELRADTLAPYERPRPNRERYDPRTRDWYRRAIAQAGTVVWMPPYMFTEGVKGVTVAVAIMDPSREAARRAHRRLHPGGRGQLPPQHQGWRA